MKGVPNRFVYGASKAAVIGLTKSVAADFVTCGIRCNAICPGTVESLSLKDRIAEQAKAQGATVDQVQAAFVVRQPMGRVGRAQEIAVLALYLGSDDSSFTTGQIHIIDGGWCCLSEGRPDDEAWYSGAGRADAEDCRGEVSEISAISRKTKNLAQGRGFLLLRAL